MAELTRDYTIVFLDGDGNTSFAKRQGGTLAILPSRRTLGFAGGNIDYSITDESGKINLNTASREMAASILKNTGVTGADRDVIADSILDWRDEGHEYQNGKGAVKGKSGFQHSVELMGEIGQVFVRDLF